MGIRFQCHECKNGLNVKSFLAGKRGTCPKCGSKFRIPESDQEFSIPLAKKTAGTKEQQAEGQGGVATLEEPTTAIDSKPDSTDALSPLADANVVWYVRPPSGGQFGPADSKLMQQWITESRVIPGSLVWREGWPQWRNAEEVFPEQFEIAPAAANIDIESDLPGATTDGAANPEVGTADSNLVSSASPTAGPGTVKRGKKQSQARMIAILTAVCLVLVGILAIVVSLTGDG